MLSCCAFYFSLYRYDNGAQLSLDIFSHFQLVSPEDSDDELFEFITQAYRLGSKNS